MLGKRYSSDSGSNRTEHNDHTGNGLEEEEQEATKT
jgi:hypothetical protein